MKILYLGPIYSGSTALHRFEALKQLGHQVEAIDTSLPFTLTRHEPWKKRLRGLMVRSNSLFDWASVHDKVRKAVQARDWDILWVDKGQFLQPQLLQEFKAVQTRALIVNYSPDDMFNPDNQTPRWRACLPLYDLFVTTKSYNVAEYRAAGAKDVFFVEKAYEPSVHRPRLLSPERQAQWGMDVCFVGAFELERAESLDTVARAGISLSLFGPWSALAARHHNVRCHEGFFAQDDYADALCSGKIALCFLRKANRDLQTARSIEIPACGVFMLAERTDEHLALFEEGKEAEFFSNDDELVEKVRFYLGHPAQREAIAQAGQARCRRSGYSNAERLRSVITYLTQRPNGTHLNT